jgi:hypothetical protein
MPGIPKTCVRASLDRALSPSLQDRTLSSWDVDQVVTIESGHFPLLSVADRLLDVLSSTVEAKATDPRA